MDELIISPARCCSVLKQLLVQVTYYFNGPEAALIRCVGEKFCWWLVLKCCVWNIFSFQVEDMEDVFQERFYHSKLHFCRKLITISKVETT
jgi:hypothetical protein